MLQTDNRIAPGSLFVDPDTHPPDESLGALGALGGSLECGVDEVSGDADEVCRLGCDPFRFGPALLFFLLQFVTTKGQAFCQSLILDIESSFL